MSRRRRRTIPTHHQSIRRPGHDSIRSHRTELEYFLHNLDRLCSASELLVQSNQPAFSGTLLEPTTVRMIDRDTPEYGAVVQEYRRLGRGFCKDLAAHPTSRALALIAVGQEGVREMEQGRVPPGFNRHHILPKSVAPTGQDQNRPINDITNLCLVETSQDPEHNPHHLWHALVLHPQTHGAHGQTRQVAAVRPLFPIYPPVKRGYDYKTPEDVYAHLESMEPGSSQALRGTGWADKIVAFKETQNHRDYRTPESFHHLIDGFKRIYQRNGIDRQIRREDLARKANSLAKSYLGRPYMVPPKDKAEDSGPESPLRTTPKDWSPYNRHRQLTKEKSRLNRKAGPSVDKVPNSHRHGFPGPGEPAHPKEAPRRGMRV